MDAGIGSLARARARSDALSDLTLLIFEVEGHRYALHASDVTEILRAALPTRLAHAPDVIEGALNIRGRIAAVLDIRARFALPRRALRPSDVMIVCDAGERLLALRADSVADIVTIPASSLARASASTGRSQYVEGAVALEDGLLLIADVPAFLSACEQLSLTNALAAQPSEKEQP